MKSVLDILLLDDEHSICTLKVFVDASQMFEWFLRRLFDDELLDQFSKLVVNKLKWQIEFNIETYLEIELPTSIALFRRSAC